MERYCRNPKDGETPVENAAPKRFPPEQLRVFATLDQLAGGNERGIEL